MKISLNGKRHSVYRPIQLAGEQFEIEVTAPSFIDRMRNSELVGTGQAADGTWIEHRLRTTITGWKDLTDDAGLPIPFDWDTLGAVCEQYPDAYAQILMFAHAAYRGLSEDEKKN